MMIEKFEIISKKHFDKSRLLWKEGNNSESRYEEGISDGIDKVLEEIKKITNEIDNTHTEKLTARVLNALKENFGHELTLTKETNFDWFFSLPDRKEIKVTKYEFYVYSKESEFDNWEYLYDLFEL